MDFAAILADSNTFADTIEMTIGTEKVTLGQLRDLSKKQQEAITEQMNSLTKERNEVKELATKAADLFSKAQETVTRQPAPRVTEQGGDDYYDTDPLYEPIRKRLSPLEKQLKESMEAIKAQNAALEKAALIFARDRWDRQFDSVKDRLKGDKYKEFRNVDKLAEYAASHQLVDAFGMPSIERAVQDITKEDEIARVREEAKKAGIEEGQRLARLSTMARPTSAAGTRAGKQSKGLDPTKNFEDLGDSVSDDPELMEQLSQLAGLEIQ